MANPCNARIATTSFQLGDTTFYKTTECKKPATKHVWVDDADARMFICGSCINRWLTQQKPVSEWYGWFDCEIPPFAPVQFSKRYYDLKNQQK